jgi:uracil-DNA glycosylase family 4
VKASERKSALNCVQEQMRACRMCVLAGYPIAPRAVFSGQVGARLMVVGQAPGSTEQLTGRPFNAGSGRRLFEWLRQAGLEEQPFRARQYMTSVTKCYPGRAASGSGDRPPTPAEQTLCRPYLQAELGLVNPQVILAVGRLAISTLLDTASPLEEVVGREFERDGRRILPLPHPSGASRWHQLEANRERIATAMRLLRRRLAEG